MNNDVIERIQQMELRFDTLQNALEAASAVVREQWFREELACLTAYYEGGRWLRDYELDEQGKLPRDLKRGVLSEDGVYRFLADVDTIALPEAMDETEE